MVDQPAPKEPLRVATNLLLRAALLIAPDVETAAYFTDIVVKGRKSAAKVSEADEEAIIRTLLIALDVRITHEKWNR